MCFRHHTQIFNTNQNNNFFLILYNFLNKYKYKPILLSSNLNKNENSF